MTQVEPCVISEPTGHRAVLKYGDTVIYSSDLFQNRDDAAANVQAASYNSDAYLAAAGIVS